MSYGAAVGEVHWTCQDGCDSRQHAIIERDYENVPHIWQVVVGDDHDEVKKLQTILESYFEKVDDESTWFIQPVEFGLADAMREAVEKEEEEIQGQEEDVKEESFGPVTNPDGTPTDFTRQMLEGTGRSLTPPFEPVSMAEGRRRAWLENQAEDVHLEADYEDRFVEPELD